MKKWNNFMMILKEQWLIVTSSMGAFRIGERNERGDRLIEFAEEHKLIIANTLFQKPKK